MSELWGHLATALATAAGLWLVGVVVSGVRTRRTARRREAVPVGSATAPPPDEFGVWTFHGPVLGSRRDRLRVRPGTVTWFDRDEIQPRWQLPAGRVLLEVRDRTWWVDVPRLALTTPDGRRRIRVTRGVDRPLGSLDAAYESAVVRDTGDLVEAMLAVGAEVTGSGRRGRP